MLVSFGVLQRNFLRLLISCAYIRLLQEIFHIVRAELSIPFRRQGIESALQNFLWQAWRRYVLRELGLCWN